MIIDPDLECGSCQNKYLEKGIKPRCLTASGCPIEELATNSEITKVINGFLNYKKAMNLGVPDRLIDQILDDSGASRLGYDLILGLEEVVAELRAKKKAEEDAKAEQKKWQDEMKKKAKKYKN